MQARSDLAEAQGQLRAAQAEVARLGAALAAAQSTETDLRGRLATEEGTTRATQQALEMAQARVTTLQNDLQARAAQVAQLTTTRDVLQGQVDSAQSEVDRQTERAAAQTAQVQALQTDVQTRQDRADAATAQTRELRARIAELEAASGTPDPEMQAELSALQQQLSDESAAKEAARAFLDAARAEIADLRAQLAAAETEASAVQPAADTFGIPSAVWTSGTPGAPGAVFQECADCPEMVVIPAGAFDRGSTEGDDDEGPVRRVTFDAPFALGRYEVTSAEWDACAAANFCRAISDDAGWGRNRRPVITVSWDDIRDFVRWMNSKVEGTPYRLPSEAEWEYAARADTKTPYWTGSSISERQANFGRNIGRTADVGTYDPNPFGLYDVHGNTWEWVEDCYASSYAGAPVDGSAVTNSYCSARVLRGGSWDDLPRNLRLAFRYGYWPDVRDFSGGFRLARTL